MVADWILLFGGAMSFSIFCVVPDEKRHFWVTKFENTAFLSVLDWNYHSVVSNRYSQSQYIAATNREIFCERMNA
jgi:hypothetical protein